MEGGELDSREEVKTLSRVQARSRGRRWCWTYKLTQKRSRVGRWRVELLLLQLFPNGGATDIVTVPHSSWDSNFVVAAQYRVDTA